MSEIQPIARDYLRQDILERFIYPDLDHDLYWSDEWESGLYVELARAGFISIAHDFPDQGCLLLPELQTAYAVLDWNNRRIPKSLRRRLLGEDSLSGRFSIRITADIAEVCRGILDRYGRECWLHPPYLDLMQRLAVETHGDFRLLSVELRESSTGNLAGGELGYTIGATWTSLSGFIARGTKWNDCGKLQLHALARILETSGYAFWNLGHPQMQYKLDLGCRILERGEFLIRWKEAIAQKPSQELASLEGDSIPCLSLNLGAGGGGA